jgi:hypothetical protein
MIKFRGYILIDGALLPFMRIFFHQFYLGVSLRNPEVSGLRVRLIRSRFFYLAKKQDKKELHFFPSRKFAFLNSIILKKADQHRLS